MAVLSSGHIWGHHENIKGSYKDTGQASTSYLYNRDSAASHIGSLEMEAPKLSILPIQREGWAFGDLMSGHQNTWTKWAEDAAQWRNPTYHAQGPELNPPRWKKTKDLKGSKVLSELAGQWSRLKNNQERHLLDNTTVLVLPARPSSRT